jgi:hypothetical protein
MNLRCKKHFKCGSWLSLIGLNKTMFHEWGKMKAVSNLAVTFAAISVALCKIIMSSTIIKSSHKIIMNK